MATRIRFDFPDLEGRLTSAMPRIMNVLAASMQTNRRLLFASGGSYNGHPGWAPLQFRVGQPLLRGGARGLSGSMGPRNDGRTPGRGVESILEINGEKVTIGTSLKYARLMNDGTSKMPGGVLRPVRAKALMIPLPQGKSATQAAKDLGASEGVTRRKIMGQLEKTSKSFTKNPTPQKAAALRKMREKLERMQEGGAKITQRVIFRKWVRIPERNFDTITAQDQAEFGETLGNIITKVLNGG